MKLRQGRSYSLLVVHSQYFGFISMLPRGRYGIIEVGLIPLDSKWILFYLNVKMMFFPQMYKSADF